jgi:long-subunit acyl-CoA synthetase (AMP-forming)
LNDEWTVENNLLTPSFKIKRHEIERKYTCFYEDWNNVEGSVARQR